jgi:hypothetical protein
MPLTIVVRWSRVNGRLRPISHRPSFDAGGVDAGAADLELPRVVCHLHLQAGNGEKESCRNPYPCLSEFRRCGF